MMFYSVMSSYTVIRCNTIVYSILFFSVLSYHDIGFSWQYKKHEAIACIYIYIERETYIHTYIFLRTQRRELRLAGHCMPFWHGVSVDAICTDS